MIFLQSFKKVSGNPESLPTQSRPPEAPPLPVEVELNLVAIVFGSVGKSILLSSLVEIHFLTREMYCGAGSLTGLRLLSSQV
jgi:hypothetical protein